MKILIVVANAGEKSFNHAIADAAKGAMLAKGHEVILHDLYKEKFNPVLAALEISERSPSDKVVKKHCEELAGADGIIIIHPNWWGQPPAMLKGWVDRVIRQGVAYKFVENDKGEGVPVGLLKAKTALVFNTSNTPQKREEEEFGDPLETLWKKCIFGLCQIKNVYRKNYGVIVISTPEQRKEWLEDVKKTVSKFF